MNVKQSKQEAYSVFIRFYPKIGLDHLQMKVKAL